MQPAKPGKVKFFNFIQESMYMAAIKDPPPAAFFAEALQLKKLTLEQVRHIDAVLASLSEYGEVQLIVQHGELRYINKVESFKAWDKHPEK
jgi:hypothetical protein